VTRGWVALLGCGRCLGGWVRFAKANVVTAGNGLGARFGVERAWTLHGGLLGVVVGGRQLCVVLVKSSHDGVWLTPSWGGISLGERLGWIEARLVHRVGVLVDREVAGLCGVRCRCCDFL